MQEAGCGGNQGAEGCGGVRVGLLLGAEGCGGVRVGGGMGFGV